jgi:hypothetical protein
MRLHVDSLPSGAEVYLLREDGSMGQRLGTTPFFIDVGLGQELVEESPNNYTHRDWAWSVQVTNNSEIASEERIRTVVHAGTAKPAGRSSSAWLP